MGVSSSIIIIISTISIISVVTVFFRLESQILQLDDDVEATMGGRDVCPHLQQPLITRAFLFAPSI